MTDINKKLDDLQTALEQERKSFKDELSDSTSKTKSEFQAEQKLMQADIDRLSDELETAVKASSRNGLGAEDKADTEYKSAMNDYIRKGQESEVLTKGMSVGANADGGYLVSEDLDTMIGKTLDNVSVMRANARVMSLPNQKWSKNYRTGGAESNWVSETVARPSTDEPNIVRLIGTYGELYAKPEATQALLNEADWDVEQFLADEIAREFGLAEEKAFWTGDGTGKPRGILNSATSGADDATRPFGTIQEVNDDVTANTLIDLMASLKTGYRSNAKFYMARSTQANVRKLQYADNSPVVRLTEDGFTIGGYEVVNADDMPDSAVPNSLPILFGDMESAYYILDVAGTTIIRDPFSNKPYIQFYTTKTVGSCLADSNAVKIIRTP